MPGDAPTLPDMLGMVPHLLSECVAHWYAKTRGGHIRTLRLVSKEVSSAVAREVTSCFVQLGVDACPEPKNLVHLMSGSQLGSLCITVTTTSARTGPSLAEQLKTCTSQMTDLLQGMGQAISSVTKLTLRMEHEFPIKRNQRPVRIVSGLEPPHPCPVPFAIITHTLCTMLAAAVPALTSLVLAGCCRDAAFPAFGSACPLLHTLQLEAISMPLTALTDLGVHLPRLNYCVLTCPFGWTDGDSMVEYVGGLLAALERAINLRMLSLKEFDGQKLWMLCKPGSWQRVPPNLIVLRSSCEIHNIHNAVALLSKLLSLEMTSTSGLLNLADILRAAPRLVRATIPTGQQITVSCDGENDGGESGPDVALLRNRLLRGLDFHVRSLGLEGWWECVQSALAVLPPLPCVTHCTIEFGGVPEPFFLAQVARVFPNVTNLKVQSHSDLLGDPETAAVLLGPLMACKHLGKLMVCVQLTHDVDSLVELILSMPVLKVFTYTESEGANPTELEDLLYALGRNMSVCDYGLEESWNSC